MDMASTGVFHAYIHSSGAIRNAYHNQLLGNTNYDTGQNTTMTMTTHNGPYPCQTTACCSIDFLPSFSYDSLLIGLSKI